MQIEKLAMREKYWSERTDQEKIELLAERVEQLQRHTNGIAEMVQKQENHIHVGERIYFHSNGPFTPMVWPNNNILNRGSK